MVKIKMQMPDGTTQEVEELEFELKHEPWTVLELSDGTTMKLRLLINKVYRAESHDPMSGDPQYIVGSQNQMHVQVPKHLKKFAKYDQPGNQEVA